MSKKEENKEGVVETKFRLPMKKVALKPVVREGGWLPKGHDGEFMFTMATAEFCVPRDIRRGGRLAQVLNEEEEQLIGEKLGANLSINRQDSENFFCIDKRSRVKVIKKHDFDKEGMVLDLSDALDYLHYKILLANRDIIAPSWEERYNKPSYRFVLVDKDQEAIEHIKKGSLKAKAYEHYAAIKDSHQRMTKFLTVYGQRPLKEVSVDFLQSQLLNIIESNVNGYLTIANDPDYDNKLLIDDAVRVGALTKIGKTKYMLPGGDVIGSTTNEAIEYLTDKRNSEVAAKIRAQIEFNDK